MYKVKLNNGQEFGPAGMDLVVQWGREGRVPLDAMLVNVDDGSSRPVLDEPALARVIQAPPTATSGVTNPVDAAEGPALIPTRNPHALVGYYVSIVGLVPVIGLLAAIPALILGIMGLRKVKQNPKVHGTAHAIIAIVLGSIGLLGNGTCVIGWIVSAATGGFGP